MAEKPAISQKSRLIAGLSLAAGVAVAGEVAATMISAATGHPVGHRWMSLYNPIDGFRWLGTIDQYCAIMPRAAEIRASLMPGAHAIAGPSCRISPVAMASINIRTGLWLVAGFVPLAGQRIQFWLASKAPVGRVLPRVKRGPGHLVLRVGRATGKLVKMGHLAGIKRGQDVCLVDDDASQDTIVIGQKGQGKTTSVIAPLLLQSFEQDCGALIFNVKGDFHRTVIVLGKKAGREVIVIGIGEDAEHIDLLDGVEPSMIATYISSLLLLVDQGKDSAIWNATASNLAHAVLGLLWYFPAHYSLPGLYRYLFVKGFGSPVKDSKGEPVRMGISIDEQIEDLVDRLVVAYKALPDGDERRAKIDSDLRNIETHCQEIQNYREQEPPTRNGVKFTLTQMLSKMMAPEVEEAFFNKQRAKYAPAFDLAKTYEEGAIFVINAPLQLYGLAAKAIMALIKLRFYVTMEQRRIKDDANQTRRVGLFIDEFQEVVTCSQHGLSDHKFLAVSRDTGTFCVFSTQSFPAIISQVGRDMSDTLLANLNQRVVLRNTDLSSIKATLEILGQTDAERKSKSENRQAGKFGLSKGTTTSAHLQPIAHAGLVRNLLRHEALFIGSVEGESADDIITLTPEFVS